MLQILFEAVTRNDSLGAADCIRRFISAGGSSWRIGFGFAAFLRKNPPDLKSGDWLPWLNKQAEGLT
jgi:hypothetical protein